MVPTELPLWRAHGLHHPYGQGRLQDGHAHVGETQRACGDRDTETSDSLSPPSVRSQTLQSGDVLTCADEDVGVFQQRHQRSPLHTLETHTGREAGQTGPDRTRPDQTGSGNRKRTHPRRDLRWLQDAEL